MSVINYGSATMSNTRTVTRRYGSEIIQHVLCLCLHHHMFKMMTNTWTVSWHRGSMSLSFSYICVHPRRILLPSLSCYNNFIECKQCQQNHTRILVYSPKFTHDYIKACVWREREWSLEQYIVRTVPDNNANGNIWYAKFMLGLWPLIYLFGFLFLCPFPPLLS